MKNKIISIKTEYKNSEFDNCCMIIEILELDSCNWDLYKYPNKVQLDAGIISIIFDYDYAKEVEDKRKNNILTLENIKKIEKGHIFKPLRFALKDYKDNERILEITDKDFNTISKLYKNGVKLYFELE